MEALAYRFETGELGTVLERLRREGNRGALVGPKGTGKTTLLGALEDCFAAEGWTLAPIRLTAEHPRPDPAAWRQATLEAGPRTLVTVDGAEQLSRARFWRLRLRTRRAGGLLVTSHRPGLLPTVHEHGSSPELLLELVESLAPELFPEVREELPALFEAHGGNLRNCLRALYDRWAEG